MGCHRGNVLLQLLVGFNERQLSSLNARIVLVARMHGCKKRLSSVTRLLLLLRRFERPQHGISGVFAVTGQGALGVEISLQLVHLRVWRYGMRMV